eukprot:s712_g25.t1
MAPHILASLQAPVQRVLYNRQTAHAAVSHGPRSRETLKQLFPGQAPATVAGGGEANCASLRVRTSEAILPAVRQGVRHEGGQEAERQEKEEGGGEVLIQLVLQAGEARHRAPGTVHLVLSQQCPDALRLKITECFSLCSSQAWQPWSIYKCSFCPP